MTAKRRGGLPRAIVAKPSPKARIIPLVRERGQRVTLRQQIGKLREATLSPRARLRYCAGIQAVFIWLNVSCLQLPCTTTDFDAQLGDWVEDCWANGDGLAKANHAIIGFESLVPSLRKQLPGTRALLRTWRLHELPNQAVPMSSELVCAVAGAFLGAG